MEDFKGTERFTVIRQLGAGAFGTVYEVRDESDGSIVALKSLRQMDPESLFRFKREFRSLVNLTHTNLVTLYELFSRPEGIFFTMELVPGANFLEYVWEYSGPGPVNSSADALKGSKLERRAVPEHRLPSLQTNYFDRLRTGLTQVAEGLLFLHQENILHRDIKPSNVKVTPDRRVVILDFGLVTELVPVDTDKTMTVAGTPAYMSPEQAAGDPVSRASDWYCVGVMLYEALTGQVPFIGRLEDVIRDKQRIEPVEPCELVPEVPDDLSALCCELLRTDPRKRPSGEDVLRRLKSAQARATHGPHALTTQPPSAVFVGRESQLKALRESFAATRSRKAVAVYLSGRSGIGKSALARRFLEDLQQEERDVVILTGRCYEQESVPYKAVDGIIDALSRYLKRLPSLKVDALMPRNVSALARVFPVLNQVVTVAAAQEIEIPEPQELRRRAFLALRELLARLSDRKSVVLFIDDLQWGDIDSAPLLDELLRPPDAPSILLIVSYRSDEAETSPLLKVLLPLLRDTVGEIREVNVGQLSQSESRELALTLMSEAGALPEQIETIARESGGSPLFIGELAHYSQVEADETPGTRYTTGPLAFDGAGRNGVTLDEMIRGRVERLPAPARNLLEVLAVAGKPLDFNVARHAARLGAQQSKVVSMLRAKYFIRTFRTRERSQVEVYHDRIRESVVADLAPETLKSYHLLLAKNLEALGEADYETLAVHFDAGGESRPAARYAVMAADQAVKAFAFDRAARLYQLAIRLYSNLNEDARQLRVRLGTALVNAGRGVEAAGEYLSAVEGASATEGLELRRRAAEQLLRNGRIDDGLSVLRAVLETIGMELAETPLRALWSLLWKRAYARLRGLKFQERGEGEIPVEELIRIDTCWSVAVGLGMVDVICGADFQVRHLLLALKAGEPFRITRALAAEAVYAAAGGARTRRRAEELLRDAHALSQRIANPEAIGRATLASAYAAYFFGEWKKSVSLTEQADKLLREHCAGVNWELSTAHHLSLRALINIGEWANLSHRFTTHLKEARERGDRFTETNLMIRIAYILHLAADETETAAAELSESIERWLTLDKGFHVQHYWGLVSHVELALYRRDGAAAWETLSGQWHGLARSLHLRVQASRVEAQHLYARAALAAALDGAAGGHGRRSREMLRLAEKRARKLAREEMPWALPLAQSIQAGVAAAQGRVEEAAGLAKEAEDGFGAADSFLYAAAARRHRGRLVGGDEGRNLMEAADGVMVNQGVKNPERMSDMLVPWPRRTE